MKRDLQLGVIFRLAAAFTLAALFSALPTRAEVTVLLEEPYSLDGELAGTGHTAIYLSSVCAASPTVLRRCEPGETGAVLSRYHHIAGYDWLAIPLLPYLYAVERAQDIPLIADVRIEAAMRDAYRRKYLERIVPDGPEGEVPKGNWYELIGSAFDRTLYGFQLPTSPEQDDAFIAAYNTRANQQAYKLVTSNCADFVREAINFYYPKAATRSFFADLDVATPKHVAKSVSKYAHHHPEVAFSAFVVPQIPGSIKRSTPIHGVVDSVFKSKKYEIPLLVFHPFVGGGFALAYVISGRFNPARNAMMFSADRELDQPLSDEQRRNYAKSLAELLHQQSGAAGSRLGGAQWREAQSKAAFAPDALGHPGLRVTLTGSADPAVIDPAIVEVSSNPASFVGLTRENILNSTGPRTLTREMLVIRLRQELSKGTSPHTSENVFRADLQLLETLLSADNHTVATASTTAATVVPAVSTAASAAQR
jgi:hypothetical protein